MKYFFTDKSIGTNQEIISKKVGAKKLVFMNQIHSANVQIVDKNSITPIKECDALITKDKDIALCVVVADCNPVLIFDEKEEVIAVAHAGRTGSYKSIVKKTIEKMCEKFTCKKENLHVKIGPSIKECCYEVGSEVIEGFEEFTKIRGKKIFLDLIALNKKELYELGISKENIEISPICTCCDEDYFSYRREGTSKRFCGVISL